MKKGFSLVGLFLMAFMFVLVSSVHASLVTSQGSIPAPQNVVTFDDFAPGWIFGSGPQQVGTPIGQDIVWTTNFGNSVIGCGGYGLGNNGNWDCNKTGYTGLNTDTGEMIFTFNSGLVSAVGGFINYAPSGAPNVVVSVHDCNGALLESYDITVDAPISTPAGNNAGDFRGIVRPTADICQFRVANQYVVLDDLTFASAPVTPVPSINQWGMIIFITLAGLLSAYQMLRQRRATN